MSAKKILDLRMPSRVFKAFSNESGLKIFMFLSEAKDIHRRDWEKNPTPGGEHG